MTVQTKGSITIEIGTEGNMREFTLNGSVGHQIQVGWRSKHDGSELPLGSLPDIIESVHSALGGGKGFKDELDKRLNDLEAIPPLAPAAQLLRNNALYVTDLGFTALYNGKEYVVSEAAFGFRVIYEPPVSIGPVGLKGFGVLFEYTPKANGNGGQGVLTTRKTRA